MKILFNYEVVVTLVVRFPMVFKILSNHLVCYISCAPGTIPYRSKVTPVIPPLQFRVLFLKTARTLPFNRFNKFGPGKAFGGLFRSLADDSSKV